MNMKGEFQGLLIPTIMAIVCGIFANIIYWILTTCLKNLKLSISTVIIIFLLACLSVAICQLLKYYYLLRDLGVVGLHNKAEETILKGLQEANYSYKWLGTSAYYVLCTPRNIEKYIKPQTKTDFLFITIDPECSMILSSQAEWAHIHENDLCERIINTKNIIQKLNEQKVRITWEGHSTFPTFRIVIINDKKVLVSFYEKGKLGKDCEQLEIKCEGLLGQWFIQYFEKSRKLANHMKKEREISGLQQKIIHFLLCKIKTIMNKDELLNALGNLYKEENFRSIERIIDDLNDEKYGWNKG